MIRALLSTLLQSNLQSTHSTAVCLSALHIVYYLDIQGLIETTSDTQDHSIAAVFLLADVPIQNSKVQFSVPAPV